MVRIDGWFDEPNANSQAFREFRISTQETFTLHRTAVTTEVPVKWQAHPSVFLHNPAEQQIDLLEVNSVASTRLKSLHTRSRLSTEVSSTALTLSGCAHLSGMELHRLSVSTRHGASSTIRHSLTQGDFCPTGSFQSISLPR